jgi:phosphoribosyl 1,2-cyclic phosphodiesterase
MEVRFFGVRGSIAVSGAHVARIGGNTPCVEVLSQGQRLILDAGTGLRALGEEMAREGQSQQATFLFSHLHWDHLQGFPFFGPGWRSDTELTLYGPGLHGARELEACLTRQMEVPCFPVPLAAMGSRRQFRSARHGQGIETGPFRITPFELPHPQGCLGYRIEADGYSFVYATDAELSLATFTAEMGRMMEGVDLLCLDAQYTPDEYEGRQGPCRRGWGHSTVVEAARVASTVQARRLLLFHHDPTHDDATVERMAEEARQLFSAAEPAREGPSLLLGAHACAA